MELLCIFFLTSANFSIQNGAKMVEWWSECLKIKVVDVFGQFPQKSLQENPEHQAQNAKDHFWTVTLIVWLSPVKPAEYKQASIR